MRPQLPKEEEKNGDNNNKKPPIFVPALLKSLTQDHNTTFRIASGTSDEEAGFDKYTYFIPGKHGSSWKPIRREPGKSWVITKEHPFTPDPSLVFTSPEPQSGYLFTARPSF